MTGFRRSRCETPNDPPLIWEYFNDGINPSPLAEAFRIAGIGGGLPDGALRYQELKRTLDDAAAGILLHSDERIEPVALDPHIWELRFTFGGRPFRLYYGEPPAAPGFLVALHFHAKVWIEGDAPATNAIQNREMQIAINRYNLCEADRWSILGTS